MMKLDRDILYTSYCVEGKTIQQIAEQSKCSITTVSRKLRDLGIATRKRGKRPADLSGAISGKLVVERMIEVHGVTKCYCKCECGGDKVTSPANIKNQRCTSCGCDSVKRASASKCWSGCGEMSGTHWRTIESNALQSKKSKVFSISPEYVWSLYLSQNRLCALSGLPIAFATGRAAYQRGETTASLDRIDSDLGYIEGNVQWVHKDVNRSKNDLSQERYLQLCEMVTQWRLRQS